VMLDRTGDVQPHSIGRSSKIRRQAAPAPTISTRRFDNFKPVVFDQFHAAGDTRAPTFCQIGKTPHRPPAKPPG
jgi:hypothetical protein